MQGEYVAFDLETTGLDSGRDEIIEIGLARFGQGQVLERFQSFVKPNRPIPADITHLTGIHQEDVDGAPTFADIMPQLTAHFGDSPVIAHNAGFDMAFMRRYGMLAGNHAVDTLELASILLPSSARYSLHSLTRAAGIKLQNAHRALDDAVATGHLYWHLWRRALQLPAAILSEIITAAQDQKWGLALVFQDALRESLRSPAQPRIKSPFHAERYDAATLSPSAAGHDPIDESLVADIFSARGGLSRELTKFESRQPQIRMARAVAEALNDGQQTMIEAGTGTGKSLAYLIPAALWAAQNGQRALVATHTINLQEQLLNKDIPLVKAVLGDGLRVALMKGRGNYLCPRRFENLRRRKPANPDELRALAKLLTWMQNGADGDRGDLTLRAGEWAAWGKVSAQDEGCSTSQCATLMSGTCPFYRARQRAERAHIVIANHALLIADARIDNRALPEYFNLIVDEAHHLEDAITNGLSRRVDLPQVLSLLRDFGGARGALLGDFLLAAGRKLPGAEFTKLQEFCGSLGATVTVANDRARKYFRQLHDYMRTQSDNRRYARRVTDAQREDGGFFHVQQAWKSLGVYFLALGDALEHLSAAMRRYREYDIDDFEHYEVEIRSSGRRLAHLHELLEGFTQAPEANSVYAVTPGDKPERLRIEVSPLHVGPLMETYLNERLESIIMTSATLRTQGNFSHLKERLYADHYQTEAVGSPFDYKRSTLVYVPNDLPEPARRAGYQRMVERGIIELAAALEGRTLVLFTSYAQLRETSKAVTPRLQLGDIDVFDQSFGTSREALLESFRNADKAVLMGTRSFWEGTDVPGPDLSAVIIARLPFAVPSDPVFAARSETYSDPFPQYAVPDAILRFRQGFGRLIRSSSDRGIVAIFDSRVINKGYGGSFLESLPDCTVQYGLLENLPRAATAWLRAT